jgi:hypothetical protein
MDCQVDAYTHENDGSNSSARTTIPTYAFLTTNDLSWGEGKTQ